LGVTDLALMADGTHDMGLVALFIDGITHCLAVDRQAFVCSGVKLIPVLQRPVEMVGVDADQDITDNRFARDDKFPLLVATAEPFPCIPHRVAPVAMANTVDSR